MRIIGEARMKQSVIVDFDNEFVTAECLIEAHKGKRFKIPRERVRPVEWIAKGELIWLVEHDYWNFNKMFDRNE